ncbi:Aste57867_13448 [Aphanomyces stellatus]|uniref:Aste57867_13448 protein n=1 Tax=Aphanomyces stellatus TaxID=120398 RepID=A0A485KYW6_9STRA|nr:hypothetical protein As57867_013398 [Aphanomyces stellatus]VFT90286.1 Aste57867_13448 [Aphanomyces stellatus]
MAAPASPAFPGPRWFGHVTIDVMDTPSKGLVSSGRHKSAHYAVTVTHKSTGATLVRSKSDFDFEQLRDDAKRLLEHGHTCQAPCPWYYVDMTEHVPRRRIFTTFETTKCSVARHVHLYQELFNHTLAFIVCPESRLCPKADSLIPTLFFKFLLVDGFDGDVDPDLLVVPKSPCSKQLVQRHTSYRTECRARSKSSAAKYCGICGLGLTPETGGVADGSGRTTLPCGHIFHDECILKAFETSLDCPTCAADDRQSSGSDDNGSSPTASQTSVETLASIDISSIELSPK